MDTSALWLLCPGHIRKGDEGDNGDMAMLRWLRPRRAATDIIQCLQTDPTSFVWITRCIANITSISNIPLLKAEVIGGARRTPDRNTALPGCPARRISVVLAVEPQPISSTSPES